jgi:hypothetical protein
MRSGTILALVGAAVAIVSVGAYAQNSSTEKAAISLTISARQSEFAVGEEIRIAVAQRNTSGRVVETVAELNGDTSDRYFFTDVFDEKENPPPLTKRGRRILKGERDPDEIEGGGNEAPYMLKPGATLVQGIVLNRLFDLSKSGKYTVEVRGSDDANRHVKSNTLTITIK